MRSDNGNGSRAAWARGFVALFAMLAMGLGLMARPAEAAPFAYVTNQADNTVSVIDTATTPPSVVATVTLPVPAGASFPQGVAVTPDGNHAYVTVFFDHTVWVIDTASNTVAGTPIPVVDPQGVAITPDGTRAYVTNNSGTLLDTVTVIDTASNTVVGAGIPVPFGPYGIAITPDGKHAYVTSFNSNTVSVIDTASNTVVATVAVGSRSLGVAVTPDGKRAYVANRDSNNVSVIDTATDTVVATVTVGSGPFGVAIAPDGKRAYVTNAISNNVSVIDTATNTVEAATIPVGLGPTGVTVTPDGKHAYVANTGIGIGSNTVSVIDTATNTVVATVTVGNGPFGVGIVPPPVGIPFLAFKAKLEIDLDRNPKEDRFELESHFTLSSAAPAIHPHRDPVTLQIGSFSITIPPGSFKKHEGENEGAVFSFHGVLDGVKLEALIKRTGTLRYAFDAEAKGADLAGTKNPVQVSLTIGGDSGTASVKADIDH
jgi:YVTN family beta-propeller protein